MLFHDVFIHKRYPMITYTPELKRAIYDCINSMDSPLGRYDNNSSIDLNEVDFLKLIWDLPAMPSEDPRFRNAEADAHQHMVNNSDWSLDDALLKRFNLLAGDEKFFSRYIEVIVSPEVRNNRTEIENYVANINTLLKSIHCELAIVDFVNELPCYRLKEGLGHSIVPIDIVPNNIPIFINTTPSEFPAFLLKEYTWDDYGHKTRYSLYYFKNNETSGVSIGVVRIMNHREDNTYKLLNEGKIYSLDKDYCSLASEISYYTQIKNVLGSSYKNFLYAIRDAACFSQICDEFRETSGFRHSLLRQSTAEEALNYAIYVLAGYDINDPTSFVFKANIPYFNDAQLPIKLDFGRPFDKSNLNRIVALIGDNGVGKTSILSQIAECIVNGDHDRFTPHIPVFSKVISASYSIFDRFYNIEGSSFNYTYCGIQKKVADQMSLMTFDEQAKRRYEAIQIIKHHDRQYNLHRYLSKLLAKDVIDCIFDDDYNFIEDNFNKVQYRLSSGQYMLLNLTIEIVANIRQNTLILLDEPEVHLHPKGITTIVGIINSICNDFASCCIMATHSSLIIQNMLSRNVIIIDRELDGSPIIRPMRIESLGESLTTITEDVFGRSVISPYYIKMVKDLVEDKCDMDNILQSIQNNDVPISMSLRVLLEKYISEK